jgi:hypothetical protein
MKETAMIRVQFLRRVALVAGLAFSAAPAGAQQDGAALEALIETWLASPHGDYHSESFVHWNADGAVPEDCAACHSEPGFLDYLGADGTAAGIVDAPAAPQSPIGCAACHNAAAHALDAVTFPSGVAMSGLGSSAICMVCHQGRQSAASVAAATGTGDEDTVSSELRFLNIHYRASAATLMGAEAAGGYEYPGRSYAGRFLHVPGADTCVACHEPHSTEVATEGCLSCHRGVDTLTAIRTRHADFDGDGDRAEGIHGEILTLQERLGAAIRVYAAEVAGTPVVYAAGAYPYFFTDLDRDGQAGPDEAVYPNRYQSWTPRLVKAAYNYQFAAKDPGAYAHNPAYMMQLLHDSLASLAEAAAIDLPDLPRP